MLTPLSDPLSKARTHRLRRMRPLAILLSALFLLAGAPGFAATFTVNSTGDDGDNLPGDGVCFTGLFTQTGPGLFTAACTLRAAIQESNALAGPDVVEFASTLPKAAGVVEIRPEAELPWIRDALTIDGYSADGYDLADPLESPIINLSGSLVPASPGLDSGLTLSTGGSNTRIQGLAIFDFPGPGVSILAALPSVHDVTIEGCEIGIWRGVFYRGNGSWGILVRAAHNITIGRTCTSKSCSGQRNVIASNGDSGIRLSASSLVDIAGNLIGTDKSGTSTFVSFGGATPNGSWGIEATHGGSNRIGRALPGGENLISGNAAGGIYIDESLDVIVNNKIGTNLAGTAALPNIGSGIQLEDGPNTVGSVGSGRNLISGNDLAGVASTGANSIVGNVIGLSADESTPIGNSDHGVQLQGSGASVRSNVISGNGRHGLLAFGADHEILSNRIGTNTSSEDLHNGQHGIILSRTDNVIVGRPDEGNIIGFNDFGIGLTGYPSGTGPNFIQSNFVGTNPNGDNLGNTSSGIYLSEVTTILVGDAGGLDSGRSNVIGFNHGYGVFLTQLANSGSGNEVSGNYIGTNASEGSLGNQLGGVGIYADGYTVGAPLAAESEDVASYGNRIAHNTGPAIVMTSDSVDSVARGNEIYGNGGGATPIDLGDDGPTPNDVGDIDDGDNHNQNSPEFIAAQTEVNETTGDLEVRYRVYSNEADASYPLTVDFYLITEPGGFADVYVGSDTYPAESATLFRSVAITPPPGVDVAGMLLATATDQGGNTSEISRQSVPVPEPGFAAALMLGVGVLASGIRPGSGRRRRR